VQGGRHSISPTSFWHHNNDMLFSFRFHPHPLFLYTPPYIFFPESSPSLSRERPKHHSFFTLTRNFLCCHCRVPVFPWRSFGVYLAFICYENKSNRSDAASNWQRSWDSICMNSSEFEALNDLGAMVFCLFSVKPCTGFCLLYSLESGPIRRRHFLEFSACFQGGGSAVQGSSTSGTSGPRWTSVWRQTHHFCYKTRNPHVRSHLCFLPFTSSDTLLCHIPTVKWSS